MPINARTIITASLFDVGIIGEDQASTVPASIYQDALRRLNNLVSGLQTQPGTVACIERTIFPLVANKQTYTIGLGGDFNVPRPTANIPGAGLLMQGLADAASVTSITRSGYTATVTQTAHGLSVGDEALIQGATQIAYNGLQTVQSVPTVDTWTFTVQGTPDTPATGTITSAAISGQPIEIPREVITIAAYQAMQIKNLPNSLFTNVYYVPSYPFGQIVLWPRINTAINQLVLYLQNVFTGFADLTTLYDFPSLPGYAEMLQYQLDLRLEDPYGKTLSEGLRGLARQTLGLIKRANNQITDLPTDATLLAHDLRGGYNINTDTGGG